MTLFFPVNNFFFNKSNFLDCNVNSIRENEWRIEKDKIKTGWNKRRVKKYHRGVKKKLTMR